MTFTFSPVIFFRSLVTVLLCSSVATAADIAVVVTDPDSRPVPAARVFLSTPLALVQTGITDERGRFRFDALHGGEYELRVAAEGFRADPIAVRLEAGETRDVSIPLHISAVSESIFVSASQVDLPLSLVPDSVTVITASQLRARQVETVADALRIVPGLTFAQNGGRGALTSLFARGGESDFTLVLIDGIRVNTFGGGYDFAHLPVGDIERIEVVRGPQSALYGSDAIGATVQIITRRGGPARADAAFETGSFTTRHLSGTFAGSRETLSWGGSAERWSSDGFTGVAPATGESVTNDDYRLTSAAFNTGWRSGGRGVDVRGDVRLTTSDRGFPGPFGSNPIGFFTAVDRVARGVNQNRLYSVGLMYPHGPRIRTRAQTSYTDLNGKFVSEFGESDSTTRRLSQRVQTDFTAHGGLGLSAGIEWERQQARSTYITGAAFTPVPVRRRVIGYFGEVRYNAASRLFLTAGLRLEQIRRDTLEPDPSLFSPRPALAADSIVSPNPKFSISYFIRPAVPGSSGWTRLRASVGTGIRPPDAFEIAFTDNPNLKPERSRSADIGVEQALYGGAVVVETTAFVNRYDDLIVAVGRSLRDASQFRTDNISNARAAGIEVAAAARTTWGMTTRFSYTWLDTAILAVDRGNGQAPPPFSPGDALVRRPPHQGAVDVTFERGIVKTHAMVEARGHVLDVEPSFGATAGLFRAPGYTVTQVDASVGMPGGLEVFARIANLFDRQYEGTFGFPAPGRSTMVGVRVAARR